MSVLRLSAARFGPDPRVYRIMTQEFLDDGHGDVAGVRTVQVRTELKEGRLAFRPVPGTQRTWRANLVLLALGFLGPEATLADALGMRLSQRDLFPARGGGFATDLPGVFAAGDCRRGQSLVVWAIREGRGAARQCDQFLMGSSNLR